MRFTRRFGMPLARRVAGLGVAEPLRAWQCLCQAMETKQLARESQRRLDGFLDQLRSSTAVDLSAKNLGEEGTQYVSEALAFNDRCVTLKP